MLPKEVLAIADDWWARDFACEPEGLRPTATHVQAHQGTLEGNDGIWILAISAAPLVSLPPSLFPKLHARARSWSRATIESPSALEAALAPIAISRIVGPAAIAYATETSLRTSDDARA